MPESPTSTTPPTYEGAIRHLDHIVAELDRSDVPLDQALRLFEDGIGHLQAAASALTQAETQLQILTEAAGGVLQAVPSPTP